MDMVKALAGTQAQSLVPCALECPICQEMMFHPFTVGCGHTFCGTCLKHWFQTRQQNETEKTCPTCRNTVRYPPVPVHAIRELVNNVLNAIKTSNPDLAEEIVKLAAPDPGSNTFEDVYFSNPVADRDDGVLRCQHCLWEIQDGFCEGCGRPHLGGQQDGGSGMEEEDMQGFSDIESEEGTPDEDDDAFINDGEIEYEDESDPDAISNITRRRPRAIVDDDSSDDDGIQVVSHSNRPSNPITIVSSDSEDNQSFDGSSGSFEGLSGEEQDIEALSPDGYGSYSSNCGSDNEVHPNEVSDYGGDIDETSIQGQRHMPIILSDSSDVISSDCESD